MNTVDSYQQVTEVLSDGPLSFHSEKGGLSLLLNGHPLYEIGYKCGTCRAIFARSGIRDLPLTPSQLSTVLEGGLHSVSPEVVATVSPLLPRGSYKVGVLTITPELAKPQFIPPWISFEHRKRPRNIPPLPAPVFDVRSEFFWVSEILLAPATANYEILLPSIPRIQINNRRIHFYRQKIRGGHPPTALALSILEWCCPQGRGFIEEGIVHFVLDGHHKMMAASELGRPVTLLSFLAYTPNRKHIRLHQDMPPSLAPA